MAVAFRRIECHGGTKEGLRQISTKTGRTRLRPASVNAEAGRRGSGGRQWLRGKPRSTPEGASAGSGQRVVTTFPRV
ncbi:hypothetical protein STENM223S_04847 [Streptomyces tendae]